MREQFSGAVDVHYNHFYVSSLESRRGPDLMTAYAGQGVGLCGAAAKGTLLLATGLHTGRVGLSLELHETPPPVDDTWEEVVEVSFTPISPSASLVEWGGRRRSDFALPEPAYRVRYCATGMDDGREADTGAGGGSPVDHYLLQFWPAPPGPAREVKRTSETAQYWHDFARDLPPMPVMPPSYYSGE
ncbi:hypothetical protein [Streptomyces fumanus]|uniref:Uncharacterized protein n=1 Tax=Streptomyces fumanus TaxID=67302 RepID=A0A919AZJ1_9ACTN|nr:hypothetical protein [Streptomyces fumanus]GHF34243.1 hypothetical protein GCM10018772_69860 [Streptomyces fumanus]